MTHKVHRRGQLVAAALRRGLTDGAIPAALSPDCEQRARTSGFGEPPASRQGAERARAPRVTSHRALLLTEGATLSEGPPRP